MIQLRGSEWESSQPWELSFREKSEQGSRCSCGKCFLANNAFREYWCKARIERIHKTRRMRWGSFESILVRLKLRLLLYYCWFGFFPWKVLLCGKISETDNQRMTMTCSFNSTFVYARIKFRTYENIKFYFHRISFGENRNSNPSFFFLECMMMLNWKLWWMKMFIFEMFCALPIFSWVRFKL